MRTQLIIPYFLSLPHGQEEVYIDERHSIVYSYSVIWHAVTEPEKRKKGC